MSTFWCDKRAERRQSRPVERQALTYFAIRFEMKVFGQLNQLRSFHLIQLDGIPGSAWYSLANDMSYCESKRTCTRFTLRAEFRREKKKVDFIVQHFTWLEFFTFFFRSDNLLFFPHHPTS